MFTLTPQKRDARQVSGRNLTDILRLKQDALKGAFDEVDEYGKRKRGEAIMEQIAGLSPEERAKTDFMALGGKGTQSEQTMDILKNLAGKQEKEVGREFTAEENRKSREARTTLAKLTDKLSKGTPLSDKEKKTIGDELIGLDTTIAQYRGQWASAAARDKPYIMAQMQDLWRKKTALEDKLNPKRSKAIGSEGFKNVMPGQYEQAKASPTKTGTFEKKTSLLDKIF